MVVPVGKNYVISDWVLLWHYFVLAYSLLVHLGCASSLGILCRSILESLVTWRIVSFSLCSTIASFVALTKWDLFLMSQLEWPAPLLYFFFFVPPDLTCLPRKHKCCFLSASELFASCLGIWFNVVYVDLLIRFVYAAISLSKAQPVIAVCVPLNGCCGLLYWISRSVNPYL